MNDGKQTIIYLVIMLLATGLSVFLAAKGKYIFHGVLRIIMGGGSLVFFLYSELLPEFYFLPIVLVAVGANVWLGVVSFLKEIRSTDGRAFLKKQTLCLNLDILMLAFNVAFAIFRSGFIADLMGRWPPEVMIAPWGAVLLAVAMGALSILLTKTRRYVLRGILYLAVGGCMLLPLFLVGGDGWKIYIDFAFVALYLWLGVVSFIKEKE